MTNEFNFKLDELQLELKTFSTVFGYDSDILPPPFDQYLEEALEEAKSLTDIRAAYKIFEDVELIENEHKIIVDGIEFELGKTVSHELRQSERIAFFVCSAGKTISEKGAKLLKGDNPVLGYVYDVLGSIIVEAACDRMQDVFLIKDVGQNNDKTTNRYSPGYCQWHVSEQHKLFSLLPKNICGVSLTDSALMDPIKSVSGIIGIGKKVKYREYTCDLCPSLDCMYRSTAKH